MKKRAIDYKALHGVVSISGGVGVGKTSAALGTGAAPERTALLDWDGKSPGIELGFYKSFSEMQVNGNELQMAEKAVETIVLLSQSDKYDVVILDAWEWFTKALPSYVFKHQNSLRTRWSPNGRFATMQKQAFAKEYEASLLALLQRSARMVIVVNHLTDQYIDDVRTGRQVPNSSWRLNQVAGFRLWLRQNAHHPCPIGLVVKNVAMRQFDKNRGVIMSVNALPKRLSTEAVPGSGGYVSIWDIITHYIENPIGTRPPLPYETPSEFEDALITGTLTADEMDAMKTAKALKLAEASEGLRERVALLLESEITNPVQILEEVKVDFPMAEFPEIVRLIGELS